MTPRNDWYHCMGNTYGRWLPGDRRGFRTRHHKRDVPYDYRHPPPKGLYDHLNERSKSLMKYEPVYLETAEQRKRVLDEFVGSLLRRGIEVAIVSVDRVHWHTLVRFPDHNPRHWLWIAKRESSHYCKQTGHAPPGGLWSLACECKPVNDATHRENVLDYIADHAKRGAVLWRRAALPALWDFDPNDLLIE